MAAGAFAQGPDIGRRHLQPLIDANVATAVQFDAGLFEPDAGGVGNASCRGQDIVPSIFCSPEGVRTVRARPQIIESTFDRVMYWVYNHI